MVITEGVPIFLKEKIMVSLAGGSITYIFSKYMYLYIPDTISNVVKVYCMLEIN